MCVNRIWFHYCNTRTYKHLSPNFTSQNLKNRKPNIFDTIQLSRTKQKRDPLTNTLKKKSWTRTYIIQCCKRIATATVLHSQSHNTMYLFCLAVYFTPWLFQPISASLLPYTCMICRKLPWFLVSPTCTYSMNSDSVCLHLLCCTKEDNIYMGWTGQGIIYGEVNSCTDVFVGKKTGHMQHCSVYTYKPSGHYDIVIG